MKEKKKKNGREERKKRERGQVFRDKMVELMVGGIERRKERVGFFCFYSGKAGMGGNS